MSVIALGLWLYSLMTFQESQLMPKTFKEDLKVFLESGEYEKAEQLCSIKKSVFSSLVQTGLSTRSFGTQAMIDAMKSEGKRASAPFWQRLSLLNDIVIIAPMLGLLGTVIGMFYAFYDINRSLESINALFDGLGVAVGTTVSGLIVAILAMIFHTTLKYRVVKMLSSVEKEAFSFSTLIRK